MSGLFSSPSSKQMDSLNHSLKWRERQEIAREPDFWCDVSMSEVMAVVSGAPAGLPAAVPAGRAAGASCLPGCRAPDRPAGAADTPPDGHVLQPCVKEMRRRHHTAWGRLGAAAAASPRPGDRSRPTDGAAWLRPVSEGTHRHRSPEEMCRRGGDRCDWRSAVLCILQSPSDLALCPSGPKRRPCPGLHPSLQTRYLHIMINQ